MARKPAGDKAKAKKPAKPAAAKGAGKRGKLAAPPVDEDGGSPWFKGLLVLGVVGALGYAATRVEVEGRTLARHATDAAGRSALVSTVGEKARAGFDAVRERFGAFVSSPETPSRTPAAPAKEKPVAVARRTLVEPARPPATPAARAPEQLTDADRRGLDALLSGR